MSIRYRLDAIDVEQTSIASNRRRIDVEILTISHWVTNLLVCYDGQDLFVAHERFVSKEIRVYILEPKKDPRDFGVFSSTVFCLKYFI